MAAACHSSWVNALSYNEGPLQAALGPDSAEALPRRRRRRKPAALRDDDDEDEEPEEEPLQEDDEDGLNNRSGPT